MLAKNRHQEHTRARRGLVLDRRNGQQFILHLPDGGQCVITSRVSSARRVKLHIAAPANVRIARAELPPTASPAA